MVDRAPTTERPFADVPNPYDHACSVLCNHPHGRRFTWFARRFVWYSRIGDRGEQSQEQQSGDSETPQISLHVDQALQKRVKDRSSRMTALASERPRVEWQPERQFVKLKDGTEDSQKIKDEKRRPPDHETSASDQDDFTVKSSGDVPADTPVPLRTIKELNTPRTSKEWDASKLDGKKNVKGKKKHKKKGKEASGIPDDADEDLDKEKRSKWHKVKKGRHAIGSKKAAIVCKEDVENPITLLEDDGVSSDSQAGSTQRRRRGMPEGEDDEVADSTWNETSLEALQQQLDKELEGSEYDPKTLEKLHGAVRAINLEKSRKRADQELHNISEEISKKNLRTNSWMSYPRVPNVHCCRFELPVDRKQLILKVFTKHRGMDSYLRCENLGSALTDIFGEPVQNELLEQVLSLGQLDDEYKIEFATFVGLAALAERILCHLGYPKRTAD